MVEDKGKVRVMRCSRPSSYGGGDMEFNRLDRPKWWQFWYTETKVYALSHEVLREATPEEVANAKTGRSTSSPRNPDQRSLLEL